MATTLDQLISSFRSLDAKDVALLNNYRLANVESAECAGHRDAALNIVNRKLIRSVNTILVLQRQQIVENAFRCYNPESFALDFAYKQREK